MINLVDNAIKFTEQGQVTLQVHGLEDQGRQLIRFDVEDTGIGIPQHRQAAILDPFIQADGSTTRRHGGTGLGLTVTEQLIERLGGELSLTSEEGSGSVFSLVLPTGVAVGAPAFQHPYSALEPELEEAGPTEPMTFSGKVLLAEDVRGNQVLMQALLTQMGLEVTIAEDGAEAIQKALSGSFDLILMDMQMPHTNGYEAARFLRQQANCPPIVALTADAMTGDDQKCLDAGCHAYLAKPIDRRELIRVIAKYLPATGPAIGGVADVAFKAP